MSFIDVSKLEYRKNVGMVLLMPRDISLPETTRQQYRCLANATGGIDEGETPEAAAFENYLKKQAYITAKLAFRKNQRLVIL